MNTVYVIIVAGGTGSRFGSKLPKQYCMMAGRPILCHAIERVRKALPEAEIITVISQEMESLWLELAGRDGIDIPRIVYGGSTRWQSVKNALDAIRADDTNAIVLIHDAARPLLDPLTAGRVVEAVKPGCSAVPVLPVTDSLRFVNPDGSSIAVDRSLYRSVVTPQGFILADLLKAYRLPYSTTFTDDASVMAAAGMTDTTLVDASPSLFKITNPGDIALAESLL